MNPLERLADLMRETKAIYQIDAKADMEADDVDSWTINLVKNEIAHGKFEADPKIPKLVMTLTPADLVAIFDGKLNVQMAFYTGRLKLKGDVLLAIKLQQALTSEA